MTNLKKNQRGLISRIIMIEKCHGFLVDHGNFNSHFTYFTRHLTYGDIFNPNQTNRGGTKGGEGA